MLNNNNKLCTEAVKFRSDFPVEYFGRGKFCSGTFRRGGIDGVG